MLAPSVLGIFTDMAGIFLIAIAPIPAMERFALFCGFWAFWLIPTGVVLGSLLLATLPAPRNVDRLTGDDGHDGGVHRAFRSALSGLASLSYGRRAWGTTAMLVVVGIAADHVVVGTARELVGAGVAADVVEAVTADDLVVAILAT